VLERRARVVSAALRAAYAWSARGRQSEAFGEVARMTGVIMFELGPGTGPATPTDLVRCLHEPLAGLLRGLPAGLDPDAGPSVERVRLLADGALTDEAYEVGSDFIREVIGGRDPGRDWLPSWSWMRAEDIERQTFTKLIAAGSAEVYRTTRQFLIEHLRGWNRSWRRPATTPARSESRGTCQSPTAASGRRGTAHGGGRARTAGGRWWCTGPCCAAATRTIVQLSRSPP
jgi:hypothetical protein